MDGKRVILENTFTKAYELERFTQFIKEFFNNCTIVSKVYKDYWNWSEFSYYMNCYTHIGNYIDQDKNKLAIFAVELKKNRNVERSRSMQRNFISKLLSKANYDAAIVAFYSEDEPKWRLSLVRLDYEFAKGRVKSKLTPAKRYSYLVGEKEPCHTAKERLLPIFENDKFNPTLDNIEEAFNVEKVTEEFFKKYREKYCELKDHLDGSDDFNEEAEKHNFTSEQFAKKLMGQLAFLYFIQKKGWLGVKVLPHTINDKQYKNAYYNHNKSAKRIVDQVFKQISEDSYKLNHEVLKNFNEEDSDILAGCFKAEKWGSGEKSFIRHLFNNCKRLEEKKDKNFFDDYLEPLFYEALNNKRGDNNYYNKFNCKIPFLNGGLFEPLENYDWKNSTFEIPNDLFSNIDIKGEENADGILDIFDRYNFTMNEDEPLEREVAVDPEMLGKIFENLLDVKDRKSKGAFYTPREIVHYMCQESLVNYLVNETGIEYEDIKDFIIYGEIMKDEDTGNEIKLGTEQMQIPLSVYNNLKLIDDKLADVRIADPAVGSGAFPMGMISEIVKARNNITEYFVAQYIITKEMNDSQKKMKQSQRARLYESRNPYKLKRNIIKNSIYAVDIEASAVDITKLRIWLSLVVDEDLEPTYDELILGFDKQKDPQALPNLDYNIMCGNSLIDEFEGIKLFDDSILDKKEHLLETEISNWQMSLFNDNIEKLLETLFRQQDRFYGEDDSKHKLEIKKNIEKTIDDMIRLKLANDNNSEGLARYEESLKQKTKPYFLWKLDFGKIFKDKGGFDIVIGNPPYVGESGNKDTFREISKTTFGRKYHEGKMDLYYYFFHKGLDISKYNSILAFITTNYYISADGAKKLRQDLKERTTIKKLINFNELKIFESARGQHNMITIIKKQKSNNDCVKCCITKRTGTSRKNDISSILMWNDKETKYIDKDIEELYDNNNCIVMNENTSILKKIIQKSNYKLNEDDIGNGIDILQECVTDKHMNIMPNLVKDSGIFSLSSNEVRELSLNEEEIKIIKPYYTSNQIKKFKINDKNDKWIIYTDKETINKIDKMPNIKKHFDKYKDIITSDNKPYGLHRARNKHLFEGEKILSLRMTKTPMFTYSNIDSYVTRAYLIIKPKKQINLKYLTGLLNSNVIYYWLENRGKVKGRQLQIDKKPLANIPLIIGNRELEQEIANLVDEILISNESIQIEKKINKLVYDLYCLSKDEIKEIENFISKHV